MNIVAIGGRVDVDEGRPLDDYILRLARRSPPRVCIVPTASGDEPSGVVDFYDRLRGRAEVSHLTFFPWPPGDLRTLALEQDVIVVGGGNTANMLAIWRLHGFDQLLRRAGEQGIVLAGSSAGGICWFEAGVTDSFGPQLAPMECLGFLAGSFCPHWNDEEQRRPVYHRLLREGFPAGYAADAGVALHFVDGELREVVACEEGSAAYRLEHVHGDVVETALPARLLQ